MTPERWKRAKEIFHATLERPASERVTFLDQVCADDDSLRREVESLVRSHEQTGGFIDLPAYEAAAEMLFEDQELVSGQRIGHYEILSTLGKGGMGEVYLARDSRLNRKVALKLLPPDFTRDVTRLRRFEQEARATSALNHPNILTIYEIGAADGHHFIATEFIDGETLRLRMRSTAPYTGSDAVNAMPRRMRLADVLSVAEQVASALAAAHAAGIVHRDIKPENIMLRQDGYVKVLDFGLAKLTEKKDVGPEDPTSARVRTNTGAVIGTAAYMSPEQARGLEVDARTDIWSLGVVVYEMLAGRKPFDGSTSSDLLVAILEREPPLLTGLLPELPEPFEWIVTKALTKERDDRYQTARELLTDIRRLKQRLDVAAELDRSVIPNIREGEDSGRVSTSVVPAADTSPFEGKQTTKVPVLIGPLSRHKAIATLAVVAALALLLVLYKVLTGERSSQNSKPSTGGTQVQGTAQITFSPGLDVFPALSPDGNSIAYSSDQSGSFEIYVKQVASGSREIQLTSDGQQNFQPAWSPDGQRIAYCAKDRGGIWLIPALGGAPKQLTQFGSAPAWSHDGTLIAFESDSIRDVSAGARNSLPPSTIWVISSQGGNPKQITQMGNPSGGHGAPSWSPNGQRIVFEVDDFLSSSIWSMSAKGDDLQRVSAPNQGAADPLYSPNGDGVYFTNALALWRISISPISGEPSGEPVRVAGVAPSAIRHATISADGKKIAYASLSIYSDLWSLSVSPSGSGPTGTPKQLTVERSPRHVMPTFSPDGKKIAFGLFRIGPGGDIWLVDADGKNAVQLTTDPATDNVPSWLPEGDRIAFLSDRNGPDMQLWSTTLVGGRDQLLTDLGPGVEFAKVSPDGKRVAFNSKRSGTLNIWIASLDGGPPTQLTFDKEMAAFPCWSPDGQFLAFEVARNSDNNLLIMPSAGGIPTQLTLEHGLSWPHSWSPDGDKIAFAGQRNGIWNLYSVSRTTKEQRMLTQYSKPNSFVRYPAWSPLGNQIVYEYAETTGNIWLLELK